ncbi:MAG: hypothetical protein GVY10_10000 [Verrucomicrobia bacterium]|jgi:hypothetical protein|nr:hypothetical protein [Verrucomicrobiota bacterium]
MTEFSFQTEHGALRIRQGERSLRLHPEIAWRDTDGVDKTWRPFGGAVRRTRLESFRLEAEHPEMTFVAELAVEGRHAVLRSRIIPARRAAFFLRSLSWESSREAGFPESDRLVRRSLPYDVWGVSGEFPIAEPTPEDRAEYWRSTIFEPGHAEAALTWSAKLPADWLHRFAFHGGECALQSLIEAEIPAGGVFENDPLALCLSGDLDGTLAGPESFGVSRKAPASAPLHAAWNSWDHYRLRVTQEDILENLEELKKHDWLRDLVRYVVVDDGWEARVGDWEPNEKFDKGMSRLAEKIHDAGFIPGLWAAPFFAEVDSRIYQEHPEFFVQHEGEPYRPFGLIGCGPPWGDRAYLDPTRPEVADHIYQTLRKFKSWGYRYFKTDFLANSLKLPNANPIPGAPPDQPEPDFSGKLGIHDRALGLHRGHRRCMTAIRAAIGEESFWLGCGSIWATGAGLMDASRVSADIDINWESLLNCGRNAFLNQHAHGRIWLNDPDFLVVRGRDTATDEQLADFQTEDLNVSKPKYENPFTVDEARMWAALVTLSGGMVVLSDRIRGLNDAGLDILKTIAPRLSGAPGRVLAWQGDLPSVIVQNSTKGRLLGRFNWTDRTATFGHAEIASLPEARWLDLWSGQTLPRKKALPEIELEPHSCLLLEAT